MAHCKEEFASRLAAPDVHGGKLSPEDLAAAKKNLLEQHKDYSRVIESVFSDPSILDQQAITDVANYLHNRQRGRDILKSLDMVPSEGHGTSMISRDHIAQFLDRVREKSPEAAQELKKLKQDLAGDMQKLMRVSELHDKIMDPNDRLAAILMSDIDKHNEQWKQSAPEDPIPFARSAQFEIANGDYSQAVQDATRAIEIDRKNSAAYATRASAYLQLGDFAAALSDARAALNLNPDDPLAYATLKLSEGRVAVAASGGTENTDVSGAKLSVVGTPALIVNTAGLSSLGAAAVPAATVTSAAALVKQARSALQIRDYRQAILHGSQALELDAQNISAYVVRALAYQGLHRYSESLRDAESGLALTPRSGTLFNVKAYALSRLNRPAEALAAADQAVELDAGDASAYMNRAMALAYGAGDYQSVKDAVAKAAGLNARFEPLYDRLGRLAPGSDLKFLFPTEDGSANSATEDFTGTWNHGGKRVGLVAAASLLGGILIALGLLHGFDPRLKSGPIKTVLTAVGVRTAATTGSVTPSLLRGQYKIEKKIGAGGMGVVFRGVDLSLGRSVAIKRMREELRLDRHERARFVSEARTVAALHHPNIVDIYAIVEDNEDVYLVFEFINGRTLQELIAAKGAIALPTALGIFRGMVEALEFAHGRGIIHRDLKPSNIMLDEQGRARMMDFGVARMAKEAATRLSVTNSVTGTPPYMSPEQEQGQVRPESDVYSLAICFYQMLCGKLPFTGSGAGMLMNKINMSFIPVTQLVNNLPANIDQIFTKAFECDPDRRWHTPRELFTAFAALTPHSAPPV